MPTLLLQTLLFNVVGSFEGREVQGEGGGVSPRVLDSDRKTSKRVCNKLKTFVRVVCPYLLLTSVRRLSLHGLSLRSLEKDDTKDGDGTKDRKGSEFVYQESKMLKRSLGQKNK